MQIQVRLPSGRTRLVRCGHDDSVARLQEELATLEGIPPPHQRLISAGRVLRPSTLLADASCDGANGGSSELSVTLSLGLLGGGGDGDQPDWTERGKMPGNGVKKRGPDRRAPDWHGDAAKKEAKERREKLERGELVVAVGPFCVPCGKRFAKQSVFDAHLSGKKHLNALERLGKAEEAMVCRLDMEAKKRKIDAIEASKEADRTGQRGVAPPATAEDLAAEAKRREEREEKLRQRAMKNHSAAVAAASVYDDGEAPKPDGPAAGTGQVAPTTEELAGAASGVNATLARGMQDATTRTNKFTSVEMQNLHHKLAVPKDDWFGAGGIHAAEEDQVATLGPLPPALPAP